MRKYIIIGPKGSGKGTQARMLAKDWLQPPPPSSPLERLLGDTRAETHQRLAEELLASASRDEAHERASRLAVSLPEDGGTAELRVAASEVAG